MGRVAALVTSFVALKMLSPDLFGVYVGLTAVATIAVVLSDMGVATLMVKELAAGAISDREGVRQFIRFRLHTAPIMIGIFVVGSNIICRSHVTSNTTLFWFAATSLALAVQAVPLAVLRAHMCFDHLQVATVGGRTVTAVTTLWIFHRANREQGLNLLVMAQCLGEVSTLALGLHLGWDLLRRGSVNKSRSRRVLTIRNAIPYGAVSMMTNAYNKLDVVLVAALTSIDQVGFYSVASRIQDALYLLPSVFVMVGFPTVARLYGAPGGVAQVRKLVRRLAVIGLLTSVPIVLLIFVATPHTISLLLGPAYLGAVTPIRILIWFLPFAVVIAPLYAGLAGSGYAKHATVIYIVSFFSATVGHIAFDWWAGADGAAFASLIREPAGMIAGLLITQRLYGFDRTAGAGREAALSGISLP